MFGFGLVFMTHAVTGTDAPATGAPKEPRLVCINQKVDNENCNYIYADGVAVAAQTPTAIRTDKHPIQSGDDK